MGYLSEVLADTPVAYYPLDVSLADASGNGHTLTTDANSSLAAGNGARGSAGRLNLATNTALPATDVKPSGMTAFTCELWVKTTVNSGYIAGFTQSVNTDNMIILYLGNFAGLVGANGQAVFVITHANFAVGVASSVTINDGNWHHIVGTWSGTSGVAYASSQFKIYVDGIDVTSGTTNFNPGPAAPYSPVGVWKVGNIAGGTQAVVCDVDDLALYTTALSAARVAAHYNRGFFDDNFANAPLLAQSIGLTNIDTTAWTTEASEPGGMSLTGWARFVPNRTGSFRFSTVGSSFDTLLAVYTGTALNNLVLVASDDNSGGANTSLLDATLTAGTTYYIQVGSQPAGSGGTLNFKLSSTPTPWLSTVLADSPYVAYDLLEASGTIMYDQSGNNHNGSYVGVSTLGSSQIAPGAGATSILFPGTSGVYATSAVQGWTSTTTYTFEVIGKWVSLRGSGSPNGLWQFGAETNSMVRVSDVGLRAGQLNGKSANVSYPDPGSANDIVTGKTYHIVETCDGTTKRLYVNGVQVASVGATAGIAGGSLLFPWDLANGRESNMYVSGVAMYRTALSASRVGIHFSQALSPFADNFANAGTLSLPISLLGADTTAWTTEASEPGGMSHTGWAKFTPTNTDTYTFSTVGSNYDTMITIYTGTALNNLVLVGADDNSGGSGTSLLTVTLTANITYYIQIGAQPAGSGGSLFFSLTEPYAYISKDATSMLYENISVAPATPLLDATGNLNENVGLLLVADASATFGAYEDVLPATQNIPFAGWGTETVPKTLKLPVPSGATIWFDASRVGGYANGQSIPYIKDYAGYQAHGKAVSTALYEKAQTPTGLPAFDFQSTGAMKINPPIASGSGEVFVVVKVRAVLNGLWAFGAYTGVSDECHFPYSDGKVYEGFGLPSGSRQSFTPTVTLVNNWHVYNVYSTGNDWKAYLDGVQQASLATNAVPTWSQTSWYLGGSAKSSALDLSFNGWIAEFIFYNRVLTSGERTTVTNYLTKKHITG